MMTLMFSHVIVIYIYILHRGAVPKAGHHEAPKLYEGDWYINVNIKNTHDLH